MKNRYDIKGEDQAPGGRTSSLPPWIRVRVAAHGEYARVSGVLKEGKLATVCHSASCPNRPECFNSGTATIMILGDVCTRACSFCGVRSGTPLALDPEEPARVAQAARELDLGHVVITSVTRDDLPDGGAGAFAAVIEKVRAAMLDVTVEVLTPDFGGRRRDIATVLGAGPDVFNHNLETVRRLQAKVRPDADYDRSLSVLKAAAGWPGSIAVKSGLMVGLGETDDEVYEALQDLRDAGCELITIGQYLAPSPEHLPAARYVEPEVFREYERRALEMGFDGVAAAPLVRSSYQAGDLLKKRGGKSG